MKYTMLFLALSSAWSSVPAKPASAPVTNTLLEVTKQTYDAFEHKDGVAMQALTLPSYLYVGQEGSLTLEELKPTMLNCTLYNYVITHPLLRVLSDRAAILTYRVDQAEACFGLTMPSVAYATDTFARLDGRWRVALHTETNAEIQ